MLLCLGAVGLLLVAARIWRKRSRRLYNAAVGRCWPSRLRQPPGGGLENGAGEAPEDLAGGHLAVAGLTSRGGKALSDKEPMIGANAELSDAPERS